MRPAFRPTLLQRAIMGLTALIALAIAYGGLANPDGFLAGMQLAAQGPAGLNETRGQYGGFFLLAAIYAGLGAGGYVRPTGVLGFQVVLYGGVFLGRAAHLALGGYDDFAAYPPAMRAVHIVDAAGLLLSGLALRQGARSA